MALSGRGRAAAVVFGGGFTLEIWPSATLDLPAPGLPDVYCSVASSSPVSPSILVSPNTNYTSIVNATFNLPVFFPLNGLFATLFSDNNGEALQFSVSTSATNGGWLQLLTFERDNQKQTVQNTERTLIIHNKQ